MVLPRQVRLAGRPKRTNTLNIKRDDLNKHKANTIKQHTHELNNTINDKTE